MAFFKKELDNILKAEEGVFAPDFTLKIEEKDNYTYPQNGWYWFNSMDEAILFYSKEIENNKTTITPRQARLILLEYNKLDEVESFLLTNRRAQIEWEYANTIERHSPLIESVGSALNLSKDDIDKMFLEASLL